VSYPAVSSSTTVLLNFRTTSVSRRRPRLQPAAKDPRRPSP
jgi:hypothetical protein